MMKRNAIFLLFLLTIFTGISAQDADSLTRREVLLETTMGNIRLDVAQKIDYVRTDNYDRPIDDVKIIRATIVK